MNNRNKSILSRCNSLNQCLPKDELFFWLHTMESQRTTSNTDIYIINFTIWARWQTVQVMETEMLWIYSFWLNPLHYQNAVWHRWYTKRIALVFQFFNDSNARRLQMQACTAHFNAHILTNPLPKRSQSRTRKKRYLIPLPIMDMVNMKLFPWQL